MLLIFAFSNRDNHIIIWYMYKKTRNFVSVVKDLPKLGSKIRLSALVSLRALILLVSSVNGSLLILPLDIVDILPLEVDGSDDGCTDRCSFVKKASYK